MEQEMANLLEAQKIDLEIDALEFNRKDYPKQKKQLLQAIADQEATLEALRVSIREAEAGRKNIDLEISSEREQLALREQRLLITKTNKEYTAVQHEIVQAKERIDALETESIELLNRLDVLNPDLAEKERIIEETRTANTAAIADIDRKFDSIESDVKVLNARRDGILATITPRTVTIYTRLRKGKDGIAVSTVDSVKHSCRGCFKHLPPQRVIELQRRQKMIFCENCGRILVWDSSDDK